MFCFATAAHMRHAAAFAADTPDYCFMMLPLISDADYLLPLRRYFHAMPPYFHAAASYAMPYA